MDKKELTYNILNGVSNKINWVSNDGEKLLILFTGSKHDIDLKIKEIEKLRDKDVSLSIGFSLVAENVLDTDTIINRLHPVDIYSEEDIFNLEKIVKSHSNLLVPNITMNTLSKVILGTIDTFVSNVIWSFLYSGKAVLIDFSAVNNYMGMECKNALLKDKINKYIDTIIAMGVQNIELRDYNKVLRLDSKYTCNKTLITERDLLKMPKVENQIDIGRDCIITPLAIDRAREMGIKINFHK